MEIQEKLLDAAEQVIIKLSPLVDISYLISVLLGLSEITIIAVKSEVKELLVVLKSGKEKEDVKISCHNLESNDPAFSFYFNEEKNASSEFSEPLNFLYIPNNAMLKSGAFNLISEKLGVKKLHPNTHFYTSNLLVEDFPGRILSVEIIESKQIKKGEKFNIISKNYPLAPDEIKKKYKISDGGNTYLIFTQGQKGKIILKSL